MKIQIEEGFFVVLFWFYLWAVPKKCSKLNVMPLTS